MSSYRPRSIVSLILVGFAVVLTPFVIAVVTAVTQVDRFAVESRSAVLNAGSATEDGRVMVEQITEMRRALGQSVARNGDRDLFEIYLDRRRDFRAALSGLMALDLDGLDRDRLRTIAASESDLFERAQGLRETPETADWDSMARGLAAVEAAAREVLAESGGLVQQNANELNVRAEALQRTVLVIAAAAAPATVVLVAIFTLLITRPMRELGGEIRRLGARSLDRPVRVKGPQDIEVLAAELEGLRRRINALEEQKATFLQHISHELKTPLTTIREGSELLTESLGDGRGEEAEIARLLKKDSLRLQQLIEDLLQFAKTQDLAIDLEFQAAVDLSGLIGDALARLAVVVDSKGIAMKSDLEAVSARCDAGKIRTVADNLLTNAIKYTPGGGRIEVRLSADAGFAQIDVDDSGPGVDPGDRDRIFEPFKQGSAEYESSVKGTGLGLSIAREYVEAHGGTIELLESESGAHFRVRLPIAGPGPVAPTP